MGGNPKLKGKSQGHSTSRLQEGLELYITLCILVCNISIGHENSFRHFQVLSWTKFSMIAHLQIKVKEKLFSTVFHISQKFDKILKLWPVRFKFDLTSQPLPIKGVIAKKSNCIARHILVWLNFLQSFQSYGPCKN